MFVLAMSGRVPVHYAVNQTLTQRCHPATYCHAVHMPCSANQCVCSTAAFGLSWCTQTSMAVCERCQTSDMTLYMVAAGRHACWANLLCSKFGVTMCFTGPRASMAAFSSGSKLTGLCTHKLPSESLTTAPLPFTSIPSQVKGLSAPQTLSECCVSTRPVRHSKTLKQCCYSLRMLDLTEPV